MKIPGLNYLCQSLGLKTCRNMRNDKLNVFDLITLRNQKSDEKKS